MTITTHENGDSTIIAVEGRLDTRTAAEFGDEVKNVIGNIQNLIFDFDKVEYISSTGLRVLLYAQKEMNKRGSMKIINVSDEIFDIMTDVGFTGISEIIVKE